MVDLTHGQNVTGHHQWLRITIIVGVGMSGRTLFITFHVLNDIISM